jgi:hypothetical protein
LSPVPQADAAAPVDQTDSPLGRVAEEPGNLGSAALDVGVLREEEMASFRGASVALVIVLIK